jgi:hypothetical protein
MLKTFSCIGARRSRTADCCFPEQPTTETTNNHHVEDIKTDYREIAKNPKQAMLYWLTIAMGLGSNNISIKKIYKLYKTHFIAKIKDKTPEEQYQDFLKLEKIAIDNKDVFTVYTHTNRFITNISAEKIKIEDCKEMLSTNDLCRNSWWYILPHATEHKKNSANARISISITPEGYEPLMNLFATIMHPSHELHKYITSSKIHNARYAESSVDTAILYLNNDELDEEILQKFKDIIAPIDKFAFNIPFGMQPITGCSAYGEQQRPTNTTSSTSFGMSRSKVIYDAAGACKSYKANGIAFSLEQELEKACTYHGLDPENPAFLMNNKHRFINTIPHYIP